MNLIRYFIASFILTTIVTGPFGHAQQNPIFPDNDIMSIGVYYYPEHWPEEQWERDLKNIADLGFEFTHFGEFAWAFMEPEEGNYRFEWLDRAVGIADKHGLKVIMCTPTPTPPAWLTEKHPETLIKNSQGQAAVHGTRQQASWSSPIYREYVKKIVERLGERYGNDPRIIGWQLDNEPSHYGWEQDYNESAHENFKQWAQRKYGSIENLNNRWGLAFWSEVYNNFDQIAIPNESLSPINFINQHALLDWKRFTADEAADFLKFQTDILKNHVRDQWITTNYMAGYHAVDPWRSDYLDFISWTAYPASGYTQGIGQEGFRRGDPFSIGFANDRFRPYNGKTGVMELQISQVCWGNYQPRLYPGMRKVFLHHTLSGGNYFACFYRYRQPTFNYEQDILGIVGTDGVTLTDGGKEIVEFIKEVKVLRNAHKSVNKEIPGQYRARKTAILWNNDQLWITSHQKQTNQWDYMGVVRGYYDILKSFGCPVDFISEDKDFSQYSVILVPAYELADESLVEKWRKYVEQGGQLIVTARSAVKDKEGHYPEAKRGGMIYDLIGAEIEFFDNLPPSQYAHVNYKGKSYPWNNWGESLKLTSARSLALHQDQFYSGNVAASQKKHGSGTVTYIGIDSDDKKLEREILRDVYQNAGIKIEDYPEGVIVDWRDGFWIGVNYSDKIFTIKKDKKSFIIGDSELKPAGVSVWKQ
jgi:beta-galactosidase